MCGIFGVVSDLPLVDVLLKGLKRLEYRGYDSAGVALEGAHGLFLERTVGRIESLRSALEEASRGIFQDASIGIAHSRWATHGAVTEANAHPQSDGETALVHNGIFENHTELRAFFPQKKWESETDTETLIPFISEKIRQRRAFLTAVRESLDMVRGGYALLIINKNFPQQLIVAKNGNPVTVGRGKGAFSKSFFVSSDCAAMAPWIGEKADLEDGELCLIQKGPTESKCSFFDSRGVPLAKDWEPFVFADNDCDETDDFALKEIHEQPGLIKERIAAFDQGAFANWGARLAAKDALNFVGCGTSFYAGLVGAYWFEKWARLSTHAEIASEFRYRCPVLPPKSLYVFLSQSGETLDTLKALEYATKHAVETAVMTNVLHSTMAKKAKDLLPLHAGPEMSVISTKAFTAQLAVTACLLLETLAVQGSAHRSALEADFRNVPALLRTVLSNGDAMNAAAEVLATASAVIFLGRGLCYPIALEGALKLKETSYLFAEGYPTGEMKHGPIALMDASVVSVVLAPFDDLFEKTLSNTQEIMARGGRVLFLTDTQGQEKIQKQLCEAMAAGTVKIFLVPPTGELSKAFVYGVAAAQIVSYKTAKLKGRNVDRPRNLAKAVTVE
ncbi:glutamine--fructose-6-phosphate aminotransferase [isomerizing] [Alphaproteobacteria bacterium]|nr:glutamine--fructose-6-phosphate aminotransferase [isomerizing] [Alphaproteobacteria bacterium]GHS97343.1 glutamine--fructose-6-phosphate aminotransferase [isomerizing] [Alphaproteobacteria bacterium]